MNPRHCASIVADEGVVMTAQGNAQRAPAGASWQMPELWSPVGGELDEPEE